MLGRLILFVALAAVLVAPAPARAGQPPLLVPGSDPEWRERAKERSGSAIVLLMTREAAVAIFLATLAFGGAAARLRARLSARISQRRLRDATFIVLVLAMIEGVTLPFDTARFLLARLHGLSNQSFAEWSADHLLAAAVSGAIAIALAFGFYRVVDRAPRTWWRWVALAALPLSIMATAGTPLYLSLFNTYSPLGDRALTARVLDLAARRGIPAEEVHRVDLSRQSRAPNAYVAGLGPTVVVAIGDTLLDEFADEEVLFVTAHEMGHYVLGHVWKGLALGVLATAAGAWLLQRLCREFLLRWHDRLRIDDLADVASLPLVLLIAGLMGAAALPAFNAVSRRFEAEADRFALELTVPDDVSPAAAASTFERLGRLALADPSPSPPVKVLLWSHPSLDERVEAVREHAVASGAPLW